MIHTFFEKLIPYLGRPSGVQQWHETDFENYKFMIHELMLHTVAIMLNESCFAGVASLIGQRYFLGNAGDRGGGSMVPFTVFRSHLSSLEQRNQRLGLRRLSLHADILKKRATGSLVSFDSLMQAVMFMREQFDSMDQERHQGWWPVTLVFAEDRYSPFEVFARSESAAFLTKMEVVFGGGLMGKLDRLSAAYKSGKARLPQWEHRSFNPAFLMGREKLGKLP